MANYDVQNNPYYQPPQGKNWIADRIIAAMQSFSAPKSGPAGPKAGFGAALLGSDVNRMNQAAMMRGRDVDAGRVPFDAEAAHDTAQEGLRFGNQQTLADKNITAQRAEGEAQRQAAAQRQIQGLSAEQAMQSDEWNKRSGEADARFARDLQLQNRSNSFQREQQMRDGEVTPAMKFQSQQPRVSGDVGINIPAPGHMSQMPSQYEIGMPPRPLAIPVPRARLPYLQTGNSTPVASDVIARGKYAEEMAAMEKYLQQKPAVPTGISY